MGKKIENYFLLQCIGQGNYGEVFKANKQLDETIYAVKVIRREALMDNPKLEECMMNEVKVLTKMGSCDHIVRFYELLKTKNNHYFVYGFCSGGTLEQKIKEKGFIPEEEVLAYVQDLIVAFKVLNKHKVLHRDLKPENILFHQGTIKLADFGLCKGLEPNQTMAKTMLGSPIYMAPEVLKGEPYTSKADVWSLGVIIYEMLYGECPFYSNSIAALTSKIDSSDFIVFPPFPEVSKKTKDIICRMLTRDYLRRISWIELFGQFSGCSGFLKDSIDSLSPLLPPENVGLLGGKKSRSLKECEGPMGISFLRLKHNLTRTEKILEEDQNLVSSTNKSIDISYFPKEQEGQEICLSMKFADFPKQQFRSDMVMEREDMSRPLRGKSTNNNQPQLSRNAENRLFSNDRKHTNPVPKQRSNRDLLSSSNLHRDRDFKSARYMEYLNISNSAKSRKGSLKGQNETVPHLVSHSPPHQASNSPSYLMPQSPHLVSQSPHLVSQSPHLVSQSPRRMTKPLLFEQLQKMHIEFLSNCAECEYVIKSRDITQIKFLGQYLGALNSKLTEAEGVCMDLYEKKAISKEELNQLKTMIGFEIVGVWEIIKLGKSIRMMGELNKENGDMKIKNTFERAERAIRDILFKI